LRLLVMKFGGSCLTDGDSILRAAELVRDAFNRGDGIVAVVSAMKGVTDRLLNMVEGSLRGEDVREEIESLRADHVEATRRAVGDVEVRGEVERIVTTTISELERVLTAIGYLEEVTPRSRDYILSFGERLSTPILWGAIRSQGLKASWMTGGEAGIVTDSNFGEARPLMENTRLRVEAKLKPLLEKGIIPVVTGFIGEDLDRVVTTLGRGGSDYTATLIGEVLGADEIYLWTDVEGLMTADPRIVPEARIIEEISFEEAVEMAVFGAKRMHPRALVPAMRAGIPVVIKSLRRPEVRGTRITGEVKIGEGVVKAVTLVRGVGLLNVQGLRMIGMPGVAGRVCQLLGRKGINIFMISQSVSEANISLMISKDRLYQAESLIENALLGTGLISDVYVEEDVCVVAVVGAGMRGTPGVAARVFKAVASRGINVRMIAQGSSELNISFVVKEEDGEEAVRAIHQEFNLSGKT